MANIPISKPKVVKNKKYMLVRYGQMGILGWFEHQENQVSKQPHRVIVKTERGLELGQIVGQLCPYKAGQFKLDPEQIKKYFEDSGIELCVQKDGKFIRYATAEDLSEERHLRKSALEELDCCRNFAKELNLPMKIVDAEHVFGGERVIFYFMADGRVDFRELVKKLAHEYQTRIEMRQIGPRDEAKVLGDVESCGQQCCCQRFLKVLKPVNMRMAKMQKATLDPSKISGYCGRLKCCLRYEDETYTELKKSLPRKNSLVKTNQGQQGRVVDGQILTQLVMIEMPDGSKAAVSVDELEVISSPQGGQQEEREASDTPEQSGDDKAVTDDQSLDK
jgi:cell fate regulator YaaT (PSP1 superfamily)